MRVNMFNAYLIVIKNEPFSSESFLRRNFLSSNEIESFSIGDIKTKKVASKEHQQYLDNQFQCKL